MRGTAFITTLVLSVFLTSLGSWAETDKEATPVAPSIMDDYGTRSDPMDPSGIEKGMPPAPISEDPVRVPEEVDVQKATDAETLDRERKAAVTIDEGMTMKAPDGWLLIEEDAWYAFDTQPADAFRKGFESYRSNDKAKAAHCIRQGVAFIKFQRARSTATVKESLTKSIQELDGIVQELKRGDFSSDERLDLALARANHALALHHLVRANEAWSKRNATRTGPDLRAAAECLHQGNLLVQHTIDGEASSVVETGRKLSGQLVDGSEYDSEAVARNLQDIHKEVQKLGISLESAREPEMNIKADPGAFSPVAIAPSAMGSESAMGK